MCRISTWQSFKANLQRGCRGNLIGTLSQIYPYQVRFPIEKAPTCRIVNSKVHMVVSELQNYPVRGLAFEAGCNLRHLSDVVASCCIYLQNNNIPFNLLISDCGKRVFLLPQKQARGEVSQELLDTQVNPAVWEISGHMVLKRRKDFNEASEQYAWGLLSEVSLSEDRFLDVKEYICKAAGLLSEEEYISIQQESNFESTSPKVTSQLPQDCLVLH